MFVTAEKIGDLRSLEEVRNDVGHGHAAQLWHELLEKVDREMAQDAWTPKTPLQIRCVTPKIPLQSRCVTPKKDPRSRQRALRR